MHKCTKIWKRIFKSLKPEEKRKYNDFRLQAKHKCITKFERLKAKQLTQNKKKGLLVESKRKRKIKMDRLRYRKRQKEKKLALARDLANKTILNRSKVNISDPDKQLLLRGLNFVPTPKWTSALEQSEWQSANQHVRRLEWSVALGNQTASNIISLPPKLKIPSLSRPDSDLIDDATKVYTRGGQLVRC